MAHNGNGVSNGKSVATAEPKRPRTPLEKNAAEIRGQKVDLSDIPASYNNTSSNLKVVESWHHHHANKSAKKTTLSKQVVQKIDSILRVIVKSGNPFDLDILDYRFWECIRCRWNPRKIIIVRDRDGFFVPMRIFDWWKSLNHRDRAELVKLSRMTRRANLSGKRMSLWAAARERK